MSLNKKTKKTEVIDSDSNNDSDTSIAVLEKTPILKNGRSQKLMT